MDLAYKSGTDLCFDTDVMRSAATQYDMAATDLDQLRTQLASLLTELAATGWTTGAGKAFSEMVAVDWSKTLEKYCKLLVTLSQCLDKSATEYDALVTEHVDTLHL